MGYQFQNGMELFAIAFMDGDTPDSIFWGDTPEEVYEQCKDY